MIVHVIPPKLPGGHRHEERFGDEATEQEVIAFLTEPRLDEEGKSYPPVQEFYGRLKVSDKPGHPGLLYLDHPQTVVAIGHVEKGEFVEDKRLRGPAPPAKP